MVAVTQQSMWNVMEPLTEEKKLQVYNVAIKLNESKTDKIAEFEAKMKKSQQWAKDVGLTPDDITRAIKEVRQEKRQSG